MVSIKFTRSVSRLPELPTIQEKVDIYAVESQALAESQKEEQQTQMYQALLLDACLTFGAYLVSVSPAC
jgi:hypothetical protein